jgi:hypothetical protein
MSTVTHINVPITYAKIVGEGRIPPVKMVVGVVEVVVVGVVEIVVEVVDEVLVGEIDEVDFEDVEVLVEVVVEVVVVELTYCRTASKSIQC